MNITEKVKKIISEVLAGSGNRISEKDIADNAHLQRDLYADSLDILTIRLEIEEVFSFKFTNEELKNMLTVDSICETVEKRGLTV